MIDTYLSEACLNSVIDDGPTISVGSWFQASTTSCYEVILINITFELPSCQCDSYSMQYYSYLTGPLNK